MNHSPLTKQSQRVNFKYTSSPPRWQQPQYILKASPSIQGSSPSRPLFPTQSIIPLCSTTHTSRAAITQPTLKKESQQSNSSTLRKQFVNANVLEMSFEEDKSVYQGHKNIIFEKNSEEKVLRDEIRFMRHLVDEAQNAEKQLRLQFQLYKAGEERYKDSEQSKQHEKMSIQIQQLKQIIQLYEASQQQLIRKNNDIQVELNQQISKIVYLQNAIKEKEQENIHLKRDAQLMLQEIQIRAADFAIMIQQLSTSREGNQQLQQINQSLSFQIQNSQIKLEKVYNQLEQTRQNSQNRISTLEELLHFKDEEYLNLTLQIQRKDERISSITKYYQQIINQFNQQKQQSSFKNTKSALLSNNKSSTLSEQEVNHHLFLLKNQHENIQSQDYFALKQQNEVLRQELELSKFTFQQNLQHLKEEYQEDLKRGEQNERQLAIYAKQIDILVQELESLKSKKYRYTPKIVIQEEMQQYGENEEQSQQEQRDNTKIKNDLRMYSQDCYNYCENQLQTNHQSVQFNLNDILESETMIANYVIDNRRQNRSSPQ